jgi:pyruvate dehydrogenase E2 component (dihydrolipoamide acetyltransferase)
MASEIIMPKLGETMEEGLILKWHKEEGEEVRTGEVLFEVETDKVAMEVEATESGILKKILVKEGERVPVFTPIAIIASPDEVLKEEGRVLASPRAKALAKELGIDISMVKGSGPGGRITEMDVRRFAEEMKREEVKATPLARRLAEQYGIPISDLKGTGPGGRITKEDVERAVAERVEERARIVELSGMRRTIAERMSLSKRTIPHFYLTVDVDMEEIVRMREQIMPDMERMFGVKVSFNDIVVKAVALALKLNPSINAHFEEGKVKQVEAINVGIAVAVEGGLVVPVIKDADRKPLSELAKEIRTLVEKARTGMLRLEDVSGGTFTVSNLGMYGVDEFSAIINPPQVAILAVGAITKRPLVLEGQVLPRHVATFTLSCDHRAVDGVQGATFLKDLKLLLEKPHLLIAV